MTSHLATRTHRTSAFLITVLLTGTLTAAITSSAQAATPLLDIAYKSGGNIWTQRADGTKTQLTSNINPTSWEYIPEASPNGLQIAYAAKVPLTTHIDAIWVMGIDGSAPQQVTALNTPITTSSFIADRFPRWSPDGTRISFERDINTVDAAGNFVSSTSDIVVLDVPSGSETTITGSHHNASGPAGWSPDGSRLAYWKTDTAGFSIIAADGSGEHPLSLQTPRYPSDPAWTADGNTIYFDTDSVSGVLYFTSSDQFATTLNAPAKNLTTDTTDRDPHLTPDGVLVGFTRNGVITTLPLTGGASSQQPPTGVTGFSFIPKQGRDCAPVMFVGVRGSGETTSDSGGGLGATIDSVRKTLDIYFPGMATDTVNYTATAFDPGNLLGSYRSDYKFSLTNGITALKGDLAYIFKYCTTAKIVIAGYSQGAHVAGDVYGTLNATQKSQISALLLFGDPRFNPKQPQVDDGTYSHKDEGAYQFIDPNMRVIDKNSTKYVDSICIASDPVCNYSPSAIAECITTYLRGQCVHQLYAAKGWTIPAAAWAACMVSSSPKKQNSCHSVRP